MTFKKHPWSSNYYNCKIFFNQKEYNSVDEIYKEYRKNLQGFRSMDQVMYFATSLKFLQNKELREKLCLTKQEDLDRIGGKIGERTKDIQMKLKGVK